MRNLFAVATSFGLAAALSMTASAQSTQPPASTPTQPPAQTSPAQTHERHDPAQQVTIVGCVQREADYRRDKDLGRGGALGTGAGVGNEFVLVNASMTGHGAMGTAAGTTTGSATTPPPAAATGTAAGTSGMHSGQAAGAGQAFEVSGQNEGQLAQYVGKRVEVVGKVKPAETGPTGTTGGATAGKPPAGVDITSPDLKLKEIEIVSVRESTGTCPAK